MRTLGLVHQGLETIDLMQCIGKYCGFNLLQTTRRPFKSRKVYFLESVMAVLEVVFSNLESGAELPLFFKIFDHPPAQRWMTYLEKSLHEKSEIEEHSLLNRTVRGHFFGFPDTRPLLSDLAQQINAQIEIINKHVKEPIPLRASDDMSQGLLNYLHEYFVAFRGPTLEPSQTYSKASQEFRNAIEAFNIYIHEYEHLITSRRPADDSTMARVEVLFGGKKERFELYSEDFQFFKFDQKFGQLTAHFCEVGKQLLDVYRDADEILGLDSIRPMRYMAADFDFFLGEDLNRHAVYQKNRDFHDWLVNEGYEPWDEKLGLGNLQLGQLILDSRLRKTSRHEFVKSMSGFLNIQQVLVHR